MIMAMTMEEFEALDVGTVIQWGYACLGDILIAKMDNSSAIIVDAPRLLMDIDIFLPGHIMVITETKLKYYGGDNQGMCVSSKEIQDMFCVEW